MNFKNLMLCFSIIALLFNCSSSSSDDLSNPDPDPDPDPTEKLTYTDDIKSIFDNNCVQCHGNPPTQGAPSSFNTFTLVKNGVDTGNILTRINSTSNPMPPTGLMPQSLRDDIQQWKDDGFLEN